MESLLALFIYDETFRHNDLNFVQFMSLIMVGTAALGGVVFALLPSWFVGLVPGLIVLWGELAVGIAANRVAYRLTKEAIAIEGVGIEQNPLARSMFRNGNFAPLLRVYALMVVVNLFLTIVSSLEGAVWVGLLILLLSFPLALIYDMLHDYIWLSRIKASIRLDSSVR